MNELCERHGFGPIATVRPPVFAGFSLSDDPDGLWVAEEAGDLLGFGFSWVCGDLWFLAQLFVSPGQQGRGVGRELLNRTLRHADKANATTRALVTFTFNGVSQGLYIRHGLFPRCPIYNLQIAREELAGHLDESPLHCVPLENTASARLALAQIDVQVLGVSRSKHHAFLLRDGGTKGFLLYAQQECIGYAYIADGHIGPLAVTRPGMVAAAFRTALNLAAEGASSQVSAFVPGTCSAALRVAAEHGMLITVPMVLMSSHEFGIWSQYLPRNPGFL